MIRIAVFLFLLLACSNVNAQRKKKNKKKGVAPIETPIFINKQVLQNHINILASDSFEGRRTGTIGEQLAMSYINKHFNQIGILPKGTNNSYYQSFEIFDRIQFEYASHLMINDTKLQPNTDYFPLNISANKSVEGIVGTGLMDMHTTWFFDVNDELKKQKSNIHFDINSFLTEKTEELIKKGASALIIYNSGTIADNLSFDSKTKKQATSIPVVFISKNIFKKYFSKNSDVADVKINVQIQEKTRTGTNVVGFIDNGAANTIVLGAHFDHLGYGEDKNSLHAGTKAIHNGADDNASGVAALMELAVILKNSTFKNNNYLFIAFSGEELGLYGSKYFTEHPTVDLSNINYMINMDMVGRLNDSTNAYTVGGYGTSDTWAQVLTQGNQSNGTVIKVDSSGTGPSDHTSFYRKNIPVLFFFTGTHGDYHKPSDDAEKININGVEKIISNITQIIAATDKLPKLGFLKTREQVSSSSSTRFTVSLGIMPDYTYTAGGVRVDGVSEGKLAQKTGILAGDIVKKLGDIQIDNVDGYMKALSKFKKGDNTTVTINRAGKELLYNISF
jgi:aminopeptidase YwaD